MSDFWQAKNQWLTNSECPLSPLDHNPILVTALNAVIGYERGAAIAKKAYAEGRAIIDVAKEETDLEEDELRRLLDPEGLTRGGIKK
jgi:fumarate hydratase class II